MKKNLCMVSIIVMILTGCSGASSVDKAISQVDKSIEKLEKKKGNLTEEDWQNIQKEVEEPMKVISDALENDKVGAMTKLKILSLTARWATVVSQAGLNEMEKRSGEFGKEIENATKELEKVSAKSDSTK